MAKLTLKARMMEPVETTAWKLATTADEFGRANARHHADDTAEQAESDGFDKELKQDVAGLRADGDADADLASALGDADKHDVHDADAADQERHARDGPQQQGDDLWRWN